MRGFSRTDGGVEDTCSGWLAGSDIPAPAPYSALLSEGPCWGCTGRSWSDRLPDEV